LRTELDTIEGWRALTFYQLGAVLHDMIMRRPLFSEFSEPFAVLVEAVKSEKPEVHADDVSPDLDLLAHNCLVKSPDARLALVSWNDFQPVSGTRRSVDSARERVKKRSLLTRSQTHETESLPRYSSKQIAQLITGYIDSIIRNECAGSDSFPPMELIQNIDSQPRVNVIFTASPDRDLQHQLSVCFDCELLDEATMAFNIIASASFLPPGGSHGNPPEPARIFRGPLDSSTLTSKVQDVLWCSIDLAQRQSASLITDGEDCWLNLVQTLEEQS
jgi:hypothetical protein